MSAPGDVALATTGSADLDPGPDLSAVRTALLQSQSLRRAVASGTRRGSEGRWRRAEVRLVELTAGPHLQVTTYDETQAYVRNSPIGAADELVESLLAEPFASWHVESTDAEGVRTLRWRVTRKGRIESSTSLEPGPAPAVPTAHDRSKHRLLDPGDPVLAALGISDADGRVKPTRQAKLRQVEEFLRLLDATLADAVAAGVLPGPSPAQPLRMVDLGCGNAYLSFAAYAHLRSRWDLDLVGVDVKEQARVRNTTLSERLGWTDRLRFVRASITEAEVDQPPDVVLALHACDTATDDALSRALTWGATVILAAPCCHHHVHDQLRRTSPPEPYGLLTRDGILRERLADTLTDAMRAALVREQGYRVDVVEFVGSEHTPRNTLLRAVRTGHHAPDATRQYAELASAWGVSPALAALPRSPEGAK